MLSCQIFTGPQLAHKLRVIQQAGLSNLRIVSDFDRTLTQAFVDDQPAFTSFSVLQQPGLLSDQFRQYSQQLYNIYRPLELDNSLDAQLKAQKMEEWWTYSLQALIDDQLHQDLIQQVVQNNSFKWRRGAVDLFTLTQQQQLPLAIFSSGLGNIIQAFVTHQQVPTKSMQIIANYLEFNQAGIAYKYLTPVLHAANKNELTLTERHQQVLDLTRKNVILLGDQIGDSYMSQETPDGCVLRIGFLNEAIDANLGKFQEMFDVVITGDASFDFVNNLVNDLT